MAGYLSNDFVLRYARPPSQTTIEQAVSLHRNIRDLLGDSTYATFLQGSYKNDTALHDMNDVDIVAVCRDIAGPLASSATWAAIFGLIEAKLQRDSRYAGKWTRNDKCIRVNTQVRVDIVPAVYRVTPMSDPIIIYSFGQRSERQNWPRGHFEGAARKSAETSGAFKQTVRLYKRWARCWFGRDKTAPSYYLECAIASCPSSRFTGDAAQGFVNVGEYLLMLEHARHKLPRIAGEGDLFTEAEWPRASFERFQQTLRAALPYASSAQQMRSSSEAEAAWVRAFNGQRAT